MRSRAARSRPMNSRSCGTNTTNVPMVTIVMPATSIPNRGEQEENNGRSRPADQRSWCAPAAAKLPASTCGRSQVRPRPGETAREQRQQDQGRQAVPRVEVARPEVAQEAREAQSPTDREQPPCPRSALGKRESDEPEVQDADRDERAAERGTVVGHEVDQPPVRDRTQGVLGDRQPGEVVRQELVGDGQEPREQAGRRRDRAPTPSAVPAHRHRVNRTGPCRHVTCYSQVAR